MAEQDLQRFIYRRVALEDGPIPSSLEQRLRTIISNIDRQHAHVRSAIIQDGKSRLDGLHQVRDASSMVVDDTLAGDGFTEPSEAELELLYQNLEAPHSDQDGDPCMKAPYDSSTYSASFPPATPPPEITLAKATLDRIAEYERRSRQARFGREYYKQALHRTQMSDGHGGTRSQAPPAHERQASGSVADRRTSESAMDWQPTGSVSERRPSGPTTEWQSARPGPGHRPSESISDRRAADAAIERRTSVGLADPSATPSRDPRLALYRRAVSSNQTDASRNG